MGATGTGMCLAAGWALAAAGWGTAPAGQAADVVVVVVVAALHLESGISLLIFFLLHYVI